MMRGAVSFVSALVALVAAAGLPAQAYDPTKAPQYSSPDLYRPNVDAVVIHGIGAQPVNMELAGKVNPNAIRFGAGNSISFCPALSCIYGPPNGAIDPLFFDHQRASFLISAQTQLDGQAEEQTLAVTTTINTGLLKPYAASTAYAVGDNVKVGNAIYRATRAGTTGANSAPPGTRPTSAPFTAVDESVRWLWVNDGAIAGKVGTYFETTVGPKAGSAWGFANNYEMLPGSMQATAIRYGFENDFTNSSGQDCPLGVDCVALRIGIGGTNKSTAGLNITSDNALSYAAIWGQRFSGKYLASESLIALDSNSKYGIAANSLGLGGDSFTGGLIFDGSAGASFATIVGAKSVASIKDEASSPISLLSSGNKSIAEIVLSANAPKALALNGSKSSSSIEDTSTSPVSYALGGTHAVAGLKVTAKTPIGVDLGQGNFSTFQIAGNGWNVSPAGVVSSAGYYANGFLGLSCSGAPTAAFQSTNGIVTHC